MHGVNRVCLLQGLLLIGVHLHSSRSLEHLPSPDVRAADDREPRERHKELVMGANSNLAIDLCTHPIHTYTYIRSTKPHYSIDWHSSKGCTSVNYRTSSNGTKPNHMESQPWRCLSPMGEHKRLAIPSCDKEVGCAEGRGGRDNGDVRPGAT